MDFLFDGAGPVLVMHYLQAALAVVVTFHAASAVIRDWKSGTDDSPAHGAADRKASTAPTELGRAA